MNDNICLSLFLQNKTEKEKLELFDSKKAILVFNENGENSYVAITTQYYPKMPPSLYEWYIADFHNDSYEGVIRHTNHRRIDFGILNIPKYSQFLGFYGWTMQLPSPRMVYDFIYENTPNGVFFKLDVLNKLFWMLIQKNINISTFKENYIKEIN